jgi:hypothetical protein
LGTPELIEDILEALEEIYSEFDQLFANNVSFADVHLYNLTKDETYGSWDWPTLVAGGDAGQAINPGMGMFCWSPTSKPRSMAKKWLSAFAETINSDGVWSVAGMNTVMAGLVKLLAAFVGANGSTIYFRIPHFVEDKVELPVPEWSPYTEVNISQIAGFQTRRRPGTGS